MDAVTQDEDLSVRLARAFSQPKRDELEDADDESDIYGSEYTYASSYFDWEEEKRNLIKTMRTLTPIVFRVLGAALSNNFMQIYWPRIVSYIWYRKS